MADTIFLENSISDIHRGFANGSLDPLAVAQQCIARVERLDPKFHAWVCFNPDSLLAGASNVQEALAHKTQLRPLEGIPIGIKDVFNTKDFPTQMGSELWRGFTPGNDARVVYYLRNSGGLIAGKTVTAEFAVHALNETLNPHNIELTPGTSSSGSAVAVALGMVPVAIGTQTAGSIIRPASFCGVYGFKPSFGLIPRTGSLKTTDSLDTIGFFVSHPNDMFRVLEAVRVHGPNFPLSYEALKDPGRQNKPMTRPWKVGLAKTHTWEFAPDYARTALLDFVARLGRYTEFDVEEITLPSEMERSHEIQAKIYDKSLSYYFRDEYKQQDKLSLVMREMIERGNSVAIKDYHAALEAQNRLIDRMDEFFKSFDVIVCLSTAGEAPLRNVVEKLDSALVWTLTHLPTVSAPVFTSPNRLPFGLQIVARKYNDHLLLKFVENILTIGLLPIHSNKIPTCLLKEGTLKSLK